MRTTDLQSAGALRPASGPHASTHACDDTTGLRADVSRDGWRVVRPGDTRLASVLPPTGLAHAAAGPVPGGRERAPWPGSPDGGAVGAPRRGDDLRGPRFDQPVAPRGYAWWYLDALSDDRRHALTLILFIGSVFSPYYFVSRKRKSGGPYDHCAVNLALYGPPQPRWAFTEYTAKHAQATRDTLAIGDSVASWNGSAMKITV